MTKEELLALGITEEIAQNIVDNYAASYVEKSVLEAEQSKVTDLTQQLTDRDTQLTELQNQAAGNTDLQAQITALQEQNANEKASYEQTLKQKDYDYALSNALRDAKAKNPKAVQALLNTEAITLDGDKLIGLSEQLETLKKSDDYLFVPDGLKGGTPPLGSGGQSQTLTKAEFAKKSYETRMDLISKNPNLLQELK